uniref:Tudor domain-containing protein 1 isoform X2 n=1 Tax=Geotrypetes seraphini TaxID=260995 RepID=A0A6P8QPM4_GEOSA|nr:tudor domain-containing protein 1 isoform X2 [Geotrypetes seraphini]
MSEWENRRRLHIKESKDFIKPPESLRYPCSSPSYPIKVPEMRHGYLSTSNENFLKSKETKPHFVDHGGRSRSSNHCENGTNKGELGPKTSGRMIIGKHLDQFPQEIGNTLTNETEINKTIMSKTEQSVESLSIASSSSLISHLDDSHDSGSKPPHASQSKVKNFSEKYFFSGYDLSLFNSLAPAPAPLTSTCHHCGLHGSQRCAKCKQVYYCSSSCQKEDWSMHSVVCKPVRQIKMEDPCTSLTESRERKNDQQVDFPSLESPNKIGSSIQKKIMLSDLQNYELKKGMKFQGTVHEFKDPSEFFMQMCSSEVIESLGKLTLALKEKFTNLTGPGEYRPVKGEVCAAKYSYDQNWYRVLIQEVDLSQRKAQALYIDYGNKEDIDFDRIQPLYKDLELFPPYAIKCCLANIVSKHGGWTRDCISAARQLLLGGQCHSAIVLDTHQEDSICFAVDIILESGKHLDQLLLEMGYAESNKKISLKTGPILDVSLKHIKEKRTESKKELNEDQRLLVPKVISPSMGDEFPAVVAEFKRPEEFFCQQLQSAHQLTELQVALSEHCRMVPSFLSFSPAASDICCAQFTEDNQWYRATVLEYVSDDTALVGYVDYGNCEVISVSRLRPIITKFMELPIQAIKCTLAGVKPLSKTWKPEAVTLMKQLVNNKIVTVKVVDKDDTTLVVDLIDESVSPCVNVACRLIKMGFAAEERNSKVVESETSNLAEKKINEIIEKSDWAWSELPVNQVTAVRVCMLYNPGDFYCQLYKEEDLYVLNKLNMSLVKYCQETHTSVFKPEKGKICCAFFSGDENWYRGMVKEVSPEGAIKVHFVDYGNVEEVALEKLHEISSEFLKLPFQAIRCKLAGVIPVSKEWSREATERFRTYVNGVKLQACTVYVEKDKVAVEILDNSSECLQSINKLLITEHMAVKEDDKLEIPKMELAGAASAVPNMELAGAASAVPKMELAGAATAVLKMELAGAVSAVPKMELAGAISAVPRPGSMVNMMLGAEHGDGVESTGIFMAGQWKTMELPVNTVISGHVLEVKSPDLFYVLPNENTVNKDKLQWIMIEMAEYCSHQDNKQVYQPKTGEACCAKFTGDNHWYRAVVLDNLESAVKVVYVDYGNVENLPFSRILPIKASYLQLPFQIIKCSIAGLVASTGVWSSLAKEMLRKLMLGNSIVATVLRIVDNTHVLSVEVEIKDERVNIAEKLVKENLAKCSNSKIHPPDLEQKDEHCYRDLRNRVKKLEEIQQALFFFMRKHMKPEELSEIRKLMEK